MTQTTGPTPQENRANTPTIRFEDLHTSWGAGNADLGGPYQAEALSGLNLTLAPGSITVLLGDRCSGKSLVALHLLGEVQPHSGRVLVDETSLWELPETERRALHDSFGLFRGGTSIRESKLIPDHTVRENLSTHPEPRPGLTTGLQMIDLTEMIDTKVADLDSGQRRRLGLWLALADDPSVVVIDNPGEALDSRHFEAMTDIIHRWHSRVGATMLISVHSLLVANELADAVAVLREGKVVAHGPPAEVLAGITDDESFERKFNTSLGGVAEYDPQRTLRSWQRMTRQDRRKQIALVLAFFAMGAVILWALTSGIMTNPMRP
jgi:ABC-type multidrug transport system ATPase subunit